MPLILLGLLIALLLWPTEDSKQQQGASPKPGQEASPEEEYLREAA